MVVLGVDPGFGIVGWGVVTDHPETRTLGYGSIQTPARKPLYHRLGQIHEEIGALLERFHPDRVCVEKLFFGKNAPTAEGVYQARGVILASVFRAGSELMEFSPGTIKQAVTGSGRASKRDVTLMVQRLLNIKESIQPDDAADALAASIAGLFASTGDQMWNAIKGEAELQ